MVWLGGRGASRVEAGDRLSLPGCNGVVKETGGNDGAPVTLGSPSPTVCKAWYSLWAITDLDPGVTRCLDDR